MEALTEEREYYRDTAFFASVDLRIRVLQQFRHASLGVYHIDMGEGTEAIAKVAKTNHHFGCEHLVKEARLLRTLSHLECVPYIIAEYRLPRYMVLLKEFIPGSRVQHDSYDPRLLDLSQILELVHSAGVARLDLRTDNVILPSDASRGPVIIDLGHGMHSHELQESQFEIEKANDRRSIETLLCR